MSEKRFVLLDRDGTLNVERHYLSDPALVELLPGAAEGLAEMRRLGLGLLIVTNQSGLARGFLDQSSLDRIHDRLSELLRLSGVELDGIYVCPHLPEAACDCRKPRPGLIEIAARELAFDPRAAFVVGDKACDIDLGRAVGATTLLVRTGYGAQAATDASVRPHYVVDDLRHAARVMAELTGRLP